LDCEKQSGMPGVPEDLPGLTFAGAPPPMIPRTFDAEGGCLRVCLKTN
jgi:hypothetical protein